MIRKTHRALYLLLCIVAICGSLRAQTDKTITIRMLDSKTGILIASSDYLVRINHEETAHGNWVVKNEDGSGKLNLPGNATVLSVRATYDSNTVFYVNCDAAKDMGSSDHAPGLDRWYKVADIVESGVVAPEWLRREKDSRQTAGRSQPRRVCLLCQKAQCERAVRSIGPEACRLRRRSSLGARSHRPGHARLHPSG